VLNSGEGAFYGPKLEFVLRDAIGRDWQCGTVQLDFNLPERLEATYTDQNGEIKTPVMIHRAPFGSMERFVAILIEHCAGKFPLWLTPEQVRVLPLSEKFNEYAKRISELLENYDIRALVDERNEKVGKKIRDAEVEKVPYMLIVGEQEFENETVAARKQGEGDLGTFSISDFAELLNNEVENLLSY
jgi:threonyl-tRNA synthetase